MARKLVAFRISVEAEARVRALAAELGETFSTTLRLLLSKGLAEMEQKRG